MSRDLISAAHQVLSSNELEIRELVNRISAARYLDENQKEAIVRMLSEDDDAKWAADRAAAARKSSGEDPHSAGVSMADKARKKREREKEFQDKQKKKREKMDQDNQDWAADRAAAAQAAG